MGTSCSSIHLWCRWPMGSPNHSPACPTHCQPAGAKGPPHLRVQAVDATLDLSRHGPLLKLELP